MQDVTKNVLVVEEDKISHKKVNRIRWKIFAISTVFLLVHLVIVVIFMLSEAGGFNTDNATGAGFAILGLIGSFIVSIPLMFVMLQLLHVTDDLIRKDVQRDQVWLARFFTSPTRLVKSVFFFWMFVISLDLLGVVIAIFFGVPGLFGVLYLLAWLFPLGVVVGMGVWVIGLFNYFLIIKNKKKLAKILLSSVLFIVSLIAIIGFVGIVDSGGFSKNGLYREGYAEENWIFMASVLAVLVYFVTLLFFVIRARERSL